jgi:linoleoyl-CoA desaturase
MGKQTTLIKIDGGIYDVSGFAHPGGLSLLQDAEGFDVSDNFHSYHLRDNINISKYVTKVGSYSQTTKADVDKRYDGLNELKKIVRQTLRKSSYHPVQQYFVTFTVFLAWLSTYAMWLAYMNTFTSVLLGICTFPTVVNLFHSQTHRPDRPFSCTRFFYDMLGPSTDVWKYHHNILHHQNVNTMHDPDVHNAAPFVRFHPDQPFGWWNRYQTWYILPLYTLTSIGFIIQNMLVCLAPSFASFLLGDHAGGYGYISKIKYLLTRIPFFLVFFGFPSLVGGHAWDQIMIMYVINMLTSGFLLGLLLEVSHLSTETADAVTTDNFIVQQATQSVNVSSSSWLVTVLFGGLNLQIEHHLFPSLDTTQTFYAGPVIRAWLEARGIKYNNSTVFGAIYAHLAHIHKMSKK